MDELNGSFIMKRMKWIKRNDKTTYEYGENSERPKTPREIAQEVIEYLEDHNIKNRNL